MNFEQYLLENYINKGLITQEEFDSMVEEKRQQSPIIPLQEVDAFLIFDAMEKDFKIGGLEQANADLTFLIMTGGM